MVTTRANKSREEQIHGKVHVTNSKRHATKQHKTANPKQPRTDTLDDQAKSEATAKMYQLLSRLSSNSSTICPSQIARGLNQDCPARYPDWRGMMNFTRELVWAEVRKGRVEVTQGGEVRKWQDRNTLKGPIRVRRGEKWGDETSVS
jgi:hypothetical protein